MLKNFSKKTQKNWVVIRRDWTKYYREYLNIKLSNLFCTLNKNWNILNACENWNALEQVLQFCRIGKNCDRIGDKIFE